MDIIITTTKRWLSVYINQLAETYCETLAWRNIQL